MTAKIKARTQAFQVYISEKYFSMKKAALFLTNPFVLLEKVSIEEERVASN